MKELRKMADSQKIQGRVDAVSQKFDGGIKIGETWYNGTKITGNFVKKAGKGQSVEIEVDERNKIQFIKFLSQIPTSEYSGPVQTEENNEIDPEEKLLILNAEVEKYAALMQVCKTATDRIFAADEKYKDSMGQHCNSLFIALDRALKDKGIRL